MSLNELSVNRRIAKNTLYMYVRMGINMLIALYTSRVVLNALGVTDYGINNIVGSLVVMYWIFCRPLETATQRFLNIELGRNNIERFNKVFNISLQTYIALDVALVVILEIAGVWAINSYLNIPYDRVWAANWLFQCSIISMIVSMLSIPFNALIITYEKMSFYAYIGVLEALLKLLNALSLLWIRGDRLLIYGINTILVAVITFIPTVIYCRRKFKNVYIIRTSDKALFRDIISFSGWSMFGSFASMTANQGVNIVVNLFFGVVVNAAMGIANNVNMSVQKFVWSFQTAFRPQLMKLYASGRIDELYKLIYRASKFSYLLLFALACPIIFNMDHVLQLWLVNPPELASTFATLMLISALIESLSAPLWMTVQATGNIKIYQITMSAIIMMNIVLSYIFLSFGYQAYTVLAINITVNAVLLAARLWFLKRMINLSYRKFLVNVIVPIVIVSIIAIWPAKLASTNVDSFGRLATAVIIFLACYVPLTYLIGLQRNERATINHIIRSKLKC